MRKLFMIVALLALHSCSVSGITNDYNKLNENQKSKIVDLTAFENLSPEVIYKINGGELRDEVKKYPKSLVYVFKNGCTSQYCRPLIVYHHYAQRNGYKLFLVMNGYANLAQSLDMPYEGPLFAIDNDFYQIKSRNKYIRYFENELFGKPLDTKAGDYLGNLHFFENGNHQKTLIDIPNE